MATAYIDGNSLTLDELREIVYQRRPAELAKNAHAAVNKSRAIVDELVEKNQLAYGITTGVGQLSDVRIPPAKICELQVNLVRSHSVGMGEPLSQSVTRAMMLLRANALSKGFSGVRAIIIETLCALLNRAVDPV